MHANLRASSASTLSSFNNSKSVEIILFKFGMCIKFTVSVYLTFHRDR